MNDLQEPVWKCFLSLFQQICTAYMKMLPNLITGLTTSIQLIEASEKQMTPHSISPFWGKKPPSYVIKKKRNRKFAKDKANMRFEKSQVWSSFKSYKIKTHRSIYKRWQISFQLTFRHLTQAKLVNLR